MLLPSPVPRRLCDAPFPCPRGSGSHRISIGHKKEGGPAIGRNLSRALFRRAAGDHRGAGKVRKTAFPSACDFGVRALTEEGVWSRSGPRPFYDFTGPGGALFRMPPHEGFFTDHRSARAACTGDGLHTGALGAALVAGGTSRRDAPVALLPLRVAQAGILSPAPQPMDGTGGDR